MADDKKDAVKVGDTVQLVAVRMGFRNGAMVHRGQKFQFKVVALNKDGTPKLPKWAQLATIPLPAENKKNEGDLKPKAAQDAVKGKSAALANGQGQGGTGAENLV